jgi:hypothetical protein
MILDGYPIPWAIRFGKLASLLLRMNIEPLAQTCRFYVPEVEPDETSFWERRGPMESIMRLMIFPCLRECLTSLSLLSSRDLAPSWTLGSTTPDASISMKSIRGSRPNSSRNGVFPIDEWRQPGSHSTQPSWSKLT